jgi:hypothetical protein
MRFDCLAKFHKSLPFIILTLSFQSSANEVSKILAKNNRNLDNPPASLKANSESSQYRYATGIKRTEEALNQDEKLETVPVQGLEPVYQAPRSSARFRTGGLSEWAGERNFGVGFIGGGAYGIFGAETDLKVTDDWTAGLGIGTGMSYRTWGLHGRYLFRQTPLTGFVEGGYSNWYVYKVSKTGKEVFPQHMAERFLEKRDGSLVAGTRAHLLYPGFGLLYKHKSGMGFVAQVQYFINASGGFSGALGASSGLYLFF